MSCRPIKWEAWGVENYAGHLPTHVRKGVVRATGQKVVILLSRADEDRYCRAWHMSVSVDGKILFQRGGELAEDKQTAMSDLMHRANRLVESS